MRRLSLIHAAVAATRTLLELESAVTGMQKQALDADTAADCVFWTTLLCAATVTVTLALVKANGGMP